MRIAGLLFSQVGYEVFSPKRAFIRSNEMLCNIEFEIINVKTKENVYKENAKYWGQLWGIYWWELDFSDVNVSGEYLINVSNTECVSILCETFHIGRNVLWDAIIPTVAIEQFEERNLQARHQIGWKDCGATLREADSHALALLGLCDLMESGYLWLTVEEQRRVLGQLMIGCDYLVVCQKTAHELGFPKGALVHDIPGSLQVVPADVMQAAWVLCYAGRIIIDVHPEKSREYIASGLLALEYVLGLKPGCSLGFNPHTHGAPEGFVPPDQWQTRDLIYQLGAALELSRLGKKEFREIAISLANQIVDRQVPVERAEDGLYGHFYTYEDCGFTEKANTHNGRGMDMGAVLPHYIVPLINARRFLADHPDSKRWDEAIRHFAYNYFLPACRRNPFLIVPQGVFGEEGLLVFSGPWHGTNGTIGFASALASVLAVYTEDSAFKEIAVGNLQWICGLNAGITAECFKGRSYWTTEIETGTVKSFSMIEGVGRNSVKGWSGIKGSIINGFCTNEQFKTTVIPSKDTDGPWVITDEDWIPHAGGLISALTFLRVYDTYYDEVASKV